MQFGGSRINLNPEPEEHHFLRNFIIILLCTIAYLIYGMNDDNASSNIQYSSDALESPFHKEDKGRKIHNDNSDDDDADDEENDNKPKKSDGAIDKELIKMNPHVH